MRGCSTEQSSYLFCFLAIRQCYGELQSRIKTANGQPKGYVGYWEMDGVSKSYAEQRKGWMKELRKVFSDALALLKESEMIGVLKGILGKVYDYSLSRSTAGEVN